MRTDALSSLSTQLQETIHHLLLFTVQRGTEQVVYVQISGLELCIVIRTANIKHTHTHTHNNNLALWVIISSALKVASLTLNGGVEDAKHIEGRHWRGRFGNATQSVK